MTLLLATVLWLLLLALIANLLRRLPWLPGLAVAAGLGLLAWFLWRAPITGTMEAWQRAIDLDRTNTFLVFSLRLDVPARGPALLLVLWGALFAFAGAWAGADRVLFPAIPLILAALLLALSTTPLLWAPFWLVVAVILMTFTAQGASPRLARAALRIMLAPTLAFPVFLFAAWVVGQPDLSAQDPALWVTGWRMLVVALGLLLTPAPLHSWISSLGEEAPPFAAAFLVGVWQITVYALIRQVLLAYPIVADYVDPARWLPWVAVLQMAWAAIFGLGSQRLGQWWGYLLLWDYGATFLLWGLSGEFGVEAMVWLLLARPFVLLAIAAGLQTLYERFGENAAYATLNGASERLPIASLSLAAGSLFLLGWPLGALFPARLATLRLADASQGAMFLGALLTLVLMTWGGVRVVRALAQPLTDPHLPREAPRLAWLALPLLLLGLVLSIHPALLDPLTSQIALWLAQP